MSSREHWQLSGSAAELYERYPARYLLSPWAPRLLALAQLIPGERVLDVACGTGLVARLAAPAVGTTGRVIGLDLNAGMLDVARSLTPPAGAPITWIQSSAMRMDVPSGSIDVVFCQQGLQFFPDRLAALREMRRVLTPGGRLLLSVWKGMNAYHAAVAEALTQHVSAETATVFSASRIVPDADELRRLVTEAAFRDVSVELQAMTVRLPAGFSLSHLAATPVARAVEAAGAEIRAAVAHAVARALTAYADGQSLAIPDATNVVTARA